MKWGEHFIFISKMKFILEGWIVYIALVSFMYVTLFQIIASFLNDFSLASFSRKNVWSRLRYVCHKGAFSKGTFQPHWTNVKILYATICQF